MNGRAKVRLNAAETNAIRQGANCKKRNNLAPETGHPVRDNSVRARLIDTTEQSSAVQFTEVIEGE